MHSACIASHPVFIRRMLLRSTHARIIAREMILLLFISRILGIATRTHTTEPHSRIKKSNRKIVQRFEFSVFMTCKTTFFLSFLFRSCVAESGSRYNSTSPRPRMEYRTVVRSCLGNRKLLFTAQTIQTT